jgi:hypothetical protein
LDKTYNTDGIVVPIWDTSIYLVIKIIINVDVYNIFYSQYCCINIYNFIKIFMLIY